MHTMDASWSVRSGLHQVRIRFLHFFKSGVLFPISQAQVVHEYEHVDKQQHPKVQRNSLHLCAFILLIVEEVFVPTVVATSFPILKKSGELRLMFGRNVGTREFPDHFAPVGARKPHAPNGMFIRPPFAVFGAADYARFAPSLLV